MTHVVRASRRVLRAAGRGNRTRPCGTYADERATTARRATGRSGCCFCLSLENGVSNRNISGESLPFRTAADIATLAPERPEWIVPGLVSPGVVIEFDGKAKSSGKTTLIGGIVSAIVRSRPFLGHPTSASPVLWLTEERPPTFRETLRRAHLDDRTDVQVLHWHDAKHLPWPDVMAKATTYAISIGARVIVVDTIGQWAGLRGDDENNNGSQLTAAEPLQDAAAKGLAVIVARHERKGGGEVGETGRGGSAFSGAVDVVVSIRRARARASRPCESCRRSLDSLKPPSRSWST